MPDDIQYTLRGFISFADWSKFKCSWYIIEFVWFIENPNFRWNQGAGYVDTLRICWQRIHSQMLETIPQTRTETAIPPPSARAWWRDRRTQSSSASCSSWGWSEQPRTGFVIIILVRSESGKKENDQFLHHQPAGTRPVLMRLLDSHVHLETRPSQADRCLELHPVSDHRKWGYLVDGYQRIDNQPGFHHPGTLRKDRVPDVAP